MNPPSIARTGWQAGLDRAVRFGLPACLLVIVVGARWAAVARFGTDLPFWDQWDAEAVHLLVPWYEHRLTLTELFAQQNEHRAVLTKLVNLLLTIANGQWDQRLECVVNAFLPGVIAASLFALGRRTVTTIWQAPLFVLLAALYALPLAWQNVVGGWQSAQFILIGLALAAIAWLPTAPPGSRRWWLGAMAAVLSLGSLASGFLTAAIVLGLLTIRLGRRETSLRSAAPTLGLCAGLVAVGLLTRITVPYHEVLRAHSAREYFLSLGLSLQWPIPEGLGYALPLWLPWAWLAVRVQSRPPSGKRDLGYLLFGLGAWTGLQLLATAYARGGGGAPPASRYIDTLAFGCAVNALAAGWLWRHATLRPAGRLLAAALAVLFALVAARGIGLQARRIVWGDLPWEGRYNYYCEQNTRNYLASGDAAYLNHEEIPFPSAAVYQERLDKPSLRAVLPASVRPPLALAAAGAADAFPAVDLREPQDPPHRAPASPGRTGISPGTPPLTHRVSRGSFGARGAADTGRWTSAPLAGRRGWLKFELAGPIDRPGVALELREAASGRLLATVRPDKSPGDSWRAAYVPAPSAPFCVAARDDDPQRWIAFSDPVEIAPGSYWAWRAARRGLLLAECAAGIAALLGAAAWLKAFSR